MATPSRTALQVLSAIRKVLAGHTDPEERRRADAFLQTFQRTTDVLPVCMGLLQSEGLESHEHLFLVNTLYRALCSRGSRDHPRFKGVDTTVGATELLGPCFQRLCQHVDASISLNSSFLIASQYACCVAVCLLATTDGNVLGSLAQLTAATHASCGDMAVITVLQLLPEEVHNKRMLLRKEHRQLWEASVKAESSAILSTLERCWEAAVAQRANGISALQTKRENRLLQTFGTWVVHGDVPPDAIAASPMMAAAFDTAAKLTPESDLALEVLQDIVYACTTASHAPLLRPLVAFSEALGSHALEHAHDLQPDLLVQIAATAAACGEQALMCGLLVPAAMPRPFLDVLLGFACVHDTMAAAKALDFWVAFRSAMAAAPGDEARHWDLAYVPAVLRHVVASTALDRCRDPNHDDVVQHRKDMRNAVRLLTQAAPQYQDELVQDLVCTIFTEFGDLGAGAADAHVATCYSIEAALHALSALTKSIPDADDTFMPRLLAGLAALASPVHEFAARALLRTITVFLSVIPGWIEHHPPALPWVHGILLKALACPEDAALCTMRNAEDHIGAVALLKLATKCAPVLRASDLDWAGTMLAVYRANLQPAPVLSDKSLHLVLEAFACVAIGGLADYYSAAAPVVAPLTALMCDTLATAFAHRAHDEALHVLVLVLGHLTTLTQALPATASSSPHPMLGVLERHWGALFQPLLGCAEVQPAVNAFFAAVYRTLGPEAASVAMAVVPHLAAAYGATRSEGVVRVLQATLPCATESPALQSAILAALELVVLDNTRHALASDAAAARVESVGACVVAYGDYAPLLLAQSSVVPTMLAIVLQALATGPAQVLAVLPVVNALWAWRSAAGPLQASVSALLTPEATIELLARLISAAATDSAATDATAHALLNARGAFPRDTLLGLVRTAVHADQFATVSDQTKRDIVETLFHTDDKVASSRKVGRFLKHFRR
ncbi:hypothetical protein ACHHYP_11112 [Achlya hypogyna]|uniref:Exportin-1/Importin-beta-like domain-containing protein n=1 Tax=Achlya hypogyna TaxID=1202772 RepID=A0A1V9YJX9_ACHHY|nr:hypothetical protein ACHHYP_11112 [Achlya hypogyna]